MIFTLTNPYMSNTISVTSKTPKLAASEIYSILSKDIKNYMNEFYFSIKDDSENYHHYVVSENRFDNKITSTIKKAKINSMYFEDYLNELEQIQKQTGGKKIDIKDDSSSSSSSDENLYRKVKDDSLINWWYYPHLYLARHFDIPILSRKYLLLPYTLKFTLPIIR